MKVYFAYSKSYENILIETGARILYTYPGINQALPNWHLPNSRDIWIDSGGYQIGEGTNKFPVTVEGYSVWLKSMLTIHKTRISHYSCLDTSDADETMRNYQYMVNNNLDPVPVWKGDWSWRHLQDCCHQSELVAFGGLVGNGKTPSSYYRHKLEQIQAEFPFNRFHLFGLGVTSSVFDTVKPASIDCSTWIQPARSGNRVVVVNGKVKEVRLPEESRFRAQYDKTYLYTLLKESVETLKTLEG